jgi:hypothetical protein
MTPDTQARPNNKTNKKIETNHEHANTHYQHSFIIEWFGYLNRAMGLCLNNYA